MRTLKLGLFAAALLLFNCGKVGSAPKTADPEAGSPPAAVASKGKPFVLAVEHAIDDAVWLSNGHLLGASHVELFDIDPADTTSVRRIPLERPLRYLLGARGGSRVVTVEDAGVGVWDPILGKELRAITGHNAGTPVMSTDGKRLALATCDGTTLCGHLIYDISGATIGEPIATITTPSAPKYMNFPGELTFSDDGRFAHVHASGSVVIADATTGKALLRRRARRLSEGGSSMELLAFRGDNVIMTSENGLEVISLSASPPKVIAHTPDPFAGQYAVESTIDRAGERIVMFSQFKNQIFTFNVASQKTKLIKTTTYADHCASKLLAIDDDGSVKGDAGSADCSQDESFPSRGFGLVRAQNSVCRIVESQTQRVVLEHAALCGANPLTSRAPGFRSDDRFFANVFEGGTHIFDLASPANGKRVAGIGPLPTKKIEHLDALSVIEGIPLMDDRAGGTRTWLTKRTPTPADAPRIEGFRVVKSTKTHTFGVSQKGETRVVVALDRAGKEVLKETIAPFDEMIEASDNVAYLRVRPAAGGGSKNDYIKCEVGVGCKSVEIGGFIASFDHPWIAIGTRADSDPSMKAHLFNIVKNEALPLPPHCNNNAFGVTVFRDGPVVLCGREGKPALARVDGSVSTIALPDDAPKNTRLVNKGGSFLFFSGVVNAGLSPAYRIDPRNNDRVDLFLGGNHAIARFTNGTIERLGDLKASEEALRCLDGDRLLPWSACSAAYEVNGTLDR
jgi:hypothetical protein